MFNLVISKADDVHRDIIQQNRLDSVKRYYDAVDRQSFDEALDIFDSSARYDRGGFRFFKNKAEIQRFYNKERLIKGVHKINVDSFTTKLKDLPYYVRAYVTGPAMYVTGNFIGQKQNQPVYLTFKDLWVFREDDEKQNDRVVFRKTWVSQPHV